MFTKLRARRIVSSQKALALPPVGDLCWAPPTPAHGARSRGASARATTAVPNLTEPPHEASLVASTQPFSSRLDYVPIMVRLARDAHLHRPPTGGFGVPEHQLSPAHRVRSSQSSSSRAPIGPTASPVRLAPAALNGIAVETLRPLVLSAVQGPLGMESRARAPLLAPFMTIDLLHRVREILAPLGNDARAGMGLLRRWSRGLRKA